MKYFSLLIVIFSATIVWGQHRGGVRNAKASTVSDNQLFGIGIGHTGDQYLDFKEAHLSGIGGDSALQSLFEGAPVIELDARIMPKNDHGLQIGIVIDFEHKNNSTSVNGVAATSSVFEGSKLALYTLQGSWVYRLERIYFIGGINYSIVNFSASPNFSGSVSMRGGNNAHLGAGVYLSDLFALEFMLLRKRTVKFSTTTNGGIEESYGLGKVDSLTLALKCFPKLVN